MSEKNIILISQEYATHELTGKDEFTALEGRVGVAESDINDTTQRVATVESAKQDKLTAGDNITITEDNVISASGGGGNIKSDKWYCKVIDAEIGTLFNDLVIDGKIKEKHEGYEEKGVVVFTEEMTQSQAADYLNTVANFSFRYGYLRAFMRTQ